jgi:hypothetical protein
MEKFANVYVTATLLLLLEERQRKQRKRKHHPFIQLKKESVNIRLIAQERQRPVTIQGKFLKY